MDLNMNNASKSSSAGLIFKFGELVEFPTLGQKDPWFDSRDGHLKNGNGMWGTKRERKFYQNFLSANVLSYPRGSFIFFTPPIRVSMSIRVLFWATHKYRSPMGSVREKYWKARAVYLGGFNLRAVNYVLTRGFLRNVFNL